MRIRPRIKLRTKLLLLSLSLLVIPWIGYQYVRQMESFLRKGQEEVLLSLAGAIATVLNGRPELFRKQGDIIQSVRSQNHLYVRPLRSPIVLDGYTDDWEPYRERARRFGKRHILSASTADDESSLSFTQIVGSYNKHLYVLFEVRDDRIIYRDPASLRLDRSDHLLIAMQTPNGRFVKYILTTSAPGWVNAYRVPASGTGRINSIPEVRIKGEWQPRPDGYNIEIRIPLSMIGNKLAFAIADVDDPRTRRIKTIIGTTPIGKPGELGSVMLPRPEMDRLLRNLRDTDGRIWIIDRQRRVLALSGSLRPAPEKETDKGIIKGILHAIYRTILKQPVTRFKDDLSAASTLNGDEVHQALSGKPALRWRQSPDGRITIMSAAQPVWNNGRIIGAVVMERTSNRILILQNRAMEALFNLSLLVFLIATIGLLMFAARLSGRITRLRNEAEQAIGPDGRVRGEISQSGTRDEIGDLSRSFAGMLDRLSQYTRYLEGMADKLSHELRTPLTVVRSSLDNLELTASDEETKKYLQRAQDGLRRLADILNRMSEASRLEQSIQQAETERFDLATIISACVEAYRTAYPQQSFTYQPAETPLPVKGMPDLIAQMLDKLIDNAMDFTLPDYPIIIRLRRDDDQAILEVENRGPTLPDDMIHNLFDSMVSVRENRGEQPHLGLGLHIVRLIADFHHGRAAAANRPSGDGVIISVAIPLS